MKKFLFIPLDYKKGNVQLYFFEALKTQFDTRYFMGSGPDLIKNKPDYIYVQSGALPPKELAAIKRRTGAKVVQWTGDCRPELLSEVMAYKGIADKTFLTSGS